MYKLLIFVAVFSAAVKLRRLALCVYLWIQRRKFQYACSHERHISPKHVYGWRERVFQDGCPSFGAVWNTLELIHKSGYVSRVTLPHKHEDTGANAALLTYLLNGDILLLLIRRWPSPTETRPWWPNTLISGSAVTSSDGSASFTTASLDSWRYLWS